MRFDNRKSRILNRNVLLLRNRNTAGLSAAKTAKAMRIKLNRYRVIEYANAAVKPEEFLKICEHYGITSIKEMKKLLTKLV